jgi:hypothetical protein
MMPQHKYYSGVPGKKIGPYCGITKKACINPGKFCDDCPIPFQVKMFRKDQRPKGRIDPSKFGARRII